MRASTALSLIAFLVIDQVSLASASCSPLVRKEWRKLSTSDRKAYINAVKCLQALPGRTEANYTGVRSRFDDYQAEHINKTDEIHFVGFFQPWHRMFLASYESDLRSLCGYTGAQPYWNWSADSTSTTAFVNSPIFDPVTGFGGNGPYIDSSNDTSIRLHIPGKTGGGCVENGPFVNMTVNMGPATSHLNTTYNPHCLTRDLAPAFAINNLNAGNVSYVLEAETFFEFDKRVEGGITVEEMTYHGGGHLGVGGDLGEMGNVYSSPGDPLFYLHHANIDRLWYTWQLQKWNVRKAEIAGPDTQFAYPYDFFGEIPYQNVTLSYAMDFGPLMKGVPSVKISEVMDPKAGCLCYTYDSV